MTAGRGTPFGHRAPVLRGVWERIQSMGVLRRWHHLHLLLWLTVAIWLLFSGRWRWLPLVLFGWIVGHGALVMLTQWNDRWDDMARAQLRERYRDYYDA